MFDKILGNSDLVSASATTVKKDNTSAPMNTRSSNSSSLMMSKGRNVTGNENNQLKDEERNLRSRAKNPGSFSFAKHSWLFGH